MTIIDTHIHLEGRSSCSVLPAQRLYGNLSPRLDGICITDHWVLKEYKKFSLTEFKVFFGVELRSTEGDILAYGLDMLPSQDLTTKQMINFIHMHNGVAVAAHPFSNRHLAFHDAVFNYNFDAIEINGAIGKKSNELAKQAAISMNLPMTGGSDAHSVEQLNSIATHFDTKIESVRDIVNAIRAKKCRPINI
ncbi:MAG: hypothetical protein BAJALOKI3v1_360014 [Promethearchaeota archaeon]|jgi:hypothetical protein|nr:MAG: hypothetical protein BAJALOKI3v1_360014 [Candidatus Lokiarchaeota archaeon]